MIGCFRQKPLTKYTEEIVKLIEREALEDIWPEDVGLVCRFINHTFDDLPHMLQQHAYSH